MHKISDEFEFRPDRTTDYGVSCPLASKKFPLGHIMGKWCLHSSSFIFDRIIMKVASNQDRHKNSVKFDFGSNQITHFGDLSLGDENFTLLNFNISQAG